MRTRQVVLELALVALSCAVPLGCDRHPSTVSGTPDGATTDEGPEVLDDAATSPGCIHDPGGPDAGALDANRPGGSRRRCDEIHAGRRARGIRAAPVAVANFVGLARGTRPFREPGGTWMRRRFYDDLPIRRIVAGSWIVGGDPDGDGLGGPGYDLPRENLHPPARGTLAMASRVVGVDGGRETIPSGSQFYIVAGAEPAAGDNVIGSCDPRRGECHRRCARGPRWKTRHADPHPHPDRGLSARRDIA